MPAKVSGASRTTGSQVVRCLHRYGADRVGGRDSLAPSWNSAERWPATTNDPRQWLPRGFAETDTYDWLQAHFGNDEITVVSWPGCTLQDRRAERLARALLSDPETAFFQRAITGRQILRQLVSPPVDLSLAEAFRRLQGVLIGPDGETTCVILTISDRGAANRAAAVDEIRRVAWQVCGLEAGATPAGRSDGGRGHHRRGKPAPAAGTGRPLGTGCPDDHLASSPQLPTGIDHSGGGRVQHGRGDGDSVLHRRSHEPGDDDVAAADLCAEHFIGRPPGQLLS